MSIRGLEVNCIIGTRPTERKRKQQVLVDIVLGCDLQPAGRTDNLSDTVNYKSLSKSVVDMASRSRFFLIEKLADKIARLCLKIKRVKKVTVTVEKPHALNCAGCAAVTISRKR